MTLFKSEVKNELECKIEEVKQIVKHGANPIEYGMTFAIFVGKVSDHKYKLGINCQSVEKQIGDVATVADDHGFVEQPKILRLYEN